MDSKNLKYHQLKTKIDLLKGKIFFSHLDENSSLILIEMLDKIGKSVDERYSEGRFFDDLEEHLNEINSSLRLN